MPIYYIYILFSPTHNRFYIGYTSNYLQRLIDHITQETFNKFTSKYRPWQFAAVFECGTEEGAAMKIEKFIKKQKNKQFIEKLIEPNFQPSGILAQLVRVSHL